MRDRTVAIGSGGKTLQRHRMEDRLGVRAAGAHRAIRTVKQFLTYVNGGPFQPAVAIGLDQPDEFFAQIAQTLQEQRDLLCGGLADLGYDVIVPEATYFATVDVHSDAIAFCRRLPQHHRVVAIPSACSMTPTPATAWSASRSASSPRRARRGPRRLKDVDEMKVAAIQHDIVWEDAERTRKNGRASDRSGGGRRRPADRADRDVRDRVLHAAGTHRRGPGRRK